MKPNYKSDDQISVYNKWNIFILAVVLNACTTSGTNTDTFEQSQGEQDQHTAPLQTPAQSGDSMQIVNAAMTDGDGDGIADAEDQCKNTAPGAPVTTKGCDLDTDGDTIADYLDQCRGTPFGVKVDERGCGFDDDTDGVPNYRDACATTPLHVNVGGDGCEWDSDNDGVVDSKDLCAGTPPGLPVESMGCLVVEVVTLEGVYFKTGSDQLNENAKKLLRSISHTLKENPKMRIEVAGHTDNTGSDTANHSLSIRRARSAKKQLIDLGVSASTLTIKGYGDSKPVASNETSQGRAANRRVELRIVEID
ncbi:MAG: OmpA family protein [Gammaproteobacteria bacterium]|jgi:outer membrane protein OmpA-like peptidoglycan-associated protein